MSGETKREERVLGHKGYGSIPHLPGSRRGPADRGLSDQHAALLTVKTRDRHDVVIVQEKLDGSNVGACNIDGQIVAINRPGFLAATSPYPQHHEWARWVEANAERFRAILLPGWRIMGEWLYQAHGTRYALEHEPFVAFDVMKGHERANHADATALFASAGFVVPKVLHEGGALSVDVALSLLGEFGHHGALDPVEGAVWRMERKGVVDFLGKYVKPGKQDGKYLESVSGEPSVFNTMRGA